MRFPLRYSRLLAEKQTPRCAALTHCMCLCFAEVDCGKFAAEDWTSKRQPMYAEVSSTACSQSFGDVCSARCVEGFYEHPDLPSDSRTPLEYTCKAPCTDLGATGSWAKTDSDSDKHKAPADCPVKSGTVCKTGGLNCVPGKLSVSNSFVVPVMLATNEGQMIEETTLQRQYKGDADHLEGYKFGDGRGPTYKFQFVAKDVQGNLRQYNNLKEASVKDYVVVKIDRVPKDLLDGVEKLLQPSTGSGIDVDSGTWAGAMVRPYTGEVKGDQDNDGISFATSGLDGADGNWSISHQFTEHGTFYVSIYVCDGDSSTECDSHDRRHLVPGTGQPANSSEVQTKAFTVCPQGTKDTHREGLTQKNVLLGANLGACESPDGFFSVNGPGRVATYCDTGFQCPNEGGSGATWPVAEPGYWVSRWLNATKKHTRGPDMRRCKAPGGCPGSAKLYAGVDSQSGVQRVVGGPDDFVCKRLDPSSDDFGNLPRPNKLSKDHCYNSEPKDSCQGPWITPKYPRGAFVAGSKLLGVGECCEADVGHRCCFGHAFYGRDTDSNHEDACGACCMAADIGSQYLENNPSCDGRQWRTDGSSNVDGISCKPCPDESSGWFIAMAVVFVLVVGAPLFALFAEVARHAGAVQGPLLSMTTFFQSSNLFIGLHLSWTKKFKQFCQVFGSLFNFNIVGLLQIVGIPPLECAYHLKYEMKWVLIMFTPFMLPAAVYLLSFCGICARTVWIKTKQHVRAFADCIGCGKSTQAHANDFVERLLPADEVLESDQQSGDQSASRVFTLTVTESIGIVPDGTVISAQAGDLDELQETISLQLADPSDPGFGLQILVWDVDFDQFFQPDRIDDVLPDSTIRLLTNGQTQLVASVVLTPPTSLGQSRPASPDVTQSPLSGANSLAVVQPEPEPEPEPELHQPLSDLEWNYSMDPSRSRAQMQNQSVLALFEKHLARRI